MFGFRRRECPSIQLYGKLPLAKDYLRLGFGEGAGIALRDWLDATFSGGREAAPVLNWPARFLLGDAWGGCMQGLMWPSSDAGGLRPFPFLLAVERQRRNVVEDLARALAGTGAVWRELATRQQQCSTCPDGKSLLAALRGVDVRVDELPALPAAAVDLEAWLLALWPESGRAGLEADLERLAAVAVGEPVRLPLAAGGSQRQQVLAWLEILARLGMVDPRACPTTFFPAVDSVGAPGDPAPAFVTIFRSAARRGDGSWLGAVADDPLGAGDLMAGRPAVGLSGAAAAEGAPPLATSLRATVTNYLRRRGTTG